MESGAITETVPRTSGGKSGSFWCYNVYTKSYRQGNSVRKKLVKHGNSLALVIDRPILELLGIDADTPLDITTDGEVLIVSQARDDARSRAFTAALDRVNRRYGRVLKRRAE